MDGSYVIKCYYYYCKRVCSIIKRYETKKMQFATYWMYLNVTPSILKVIITHLEIHTGNNHWSASNFKEIHVSHSDLLVELWQMHMLCWKKILISHKWIENLIDRPRYVTPNCWDEKPFVDYLTLWLIGWHSSPSCPIGVHIRRLRIHKLTAQHISCVHWESLSQAWNTHRLTIIIHANVNDLYHLDFNGQIME